MNGFVDPEFRAMLEIRVARDPHSSQYTLMAWVDTAFNGGLMIPLEQIQSLGLKKAPSIEAVLADGQVVMLEMYSSVLNWFGKEYGAQVVANDGHDPMLGTVLLAGRKLLIDDEQRTPGLVEYLLRNKTGSLLSLSEGGS